MDATAHAVAGAVLGMQGRPLTALTMGIISNAVLDAIPHANYTGWRPFSPAMVVDGLIALLLVVVIARIAPRPWSAVAGAGGGILPEVERILTGHQKDFLGRPPLNLPQHEIGLPWGVLTQLVVIVGSLVLAARIGQSARRRTHGEGAG